VENRERSASERIETDDLDPGEYEYVVSTDDDSATGILTVEAVEESGFMVTLDPEEQTVTQGEQFGLSATIENVGEATDTQTVELRLDGELINDQEVVLDSGESRTPPRQRIETDDLDPGEYEYVVSTDDDSATGILTVEAADGTTMMRMERKRMGRRMERKRMGRRMERKRMGRRMERKRMGRRMERKRMGRRRTVRLRTARRRTARLRTARREENGEEENGEEENGEEENGEEENGETENGEEEKRRRRWRQWRRRWWRRGWTGRERRNH